DRDGRREPIDVIDVGLLHLAEELPGVGRERLDVAALPLGEDRVEGQAGLARPGQPGDDHQLVPRDLDVDILEVMLPSAPNHDPIVRHPNSGPGVRFTAEAQSYRGEGAEEISLSFSLSASSLPSLCAFAVNVVLPRLIRRCGAAR